MRSGNGFGGGILRYLPGTNFGDTTLELSLESMVVS